jgi:bacterioferritin-associated ferredoxin
MFNESRTEKIIGANYSQRINTHLDGIEGFIEVELLIKPNGKLIDFSVQGEIRVRDIFISLLENVVGKVFATNTTPSDIFQFTENQLIKTYWWQLLDEVHFHYAPALNNIVQVEEQKLICRCFNISESEVLNVIAQGANDVLTITNISKAGGGCGNCVIDLKELLSREDIAEVTVLEESDEKSIYKAKYPREKIGGLWPAQYLSENIIPLLEDINNKKSQDWIVSALVEDHLYIKNAKVDERLEELENYLIQNNIDLKVFYS